jgi:uncharacterized protein (DUF1015 family)
LESEFFIKSFANVPATYVADGHHRTQAAFNVGKLRKERALAAGKEVTGEEDFNFFMAIHYPDNNLKIMEYNRVLKTLNGLSTQQFLDKVAENYIIGQIPEGQDPTP